MSMINFTPLNELDSWLHAYNRSMTKASRTEKRRLWQPSVDIFESESAFVIQAELAGVPKEAIKVSVENDLLSISGEKSAPGDDIQAQRQERYFGEFKRSFKLPENVDLENIKAESKDGVLTLTLPKAEKKESLKQIEIH